MEGPEIEDDWHVFSGLNFPPDTQQGICRTHSLSQREPDFTSKNSLALCK